jgi:hypothetical protein
MGNTVKENRLMGAMLSAMQVGNGATPVMDASDDEVLAWLIRDGAEEMGLPVQIIEMALTREPTPAKIAHIAREQIGRRQTILTLISAMEDASGPMPQDLADTPKGRSVLKAVTTAREQIKKEQEWLADYRARNTQTEQTASDGVDAMVKAAREIFGEDNVEVVDATPEGIDAAIEKLDYLHKNAKGSDEYVVQREKVRLLAELKGEKQTMTPKGDRELAEGEGGYDLIGIKWRCIIFWHPVEGSDEDCIHYSVYNRK